MVKSQMLMACRLVAAHQLPKADSVCWRDNSTREIQAHGAAMPDRNLQKAMKTKNPIPSLFYWCLIVIIIIMLITQYSVNEII